MIDEERAAACTGIFKLPSAGRLYGDNFPETLEIQAFGFAVEDVLTQSIPALKKFLKITDDVVKNLPERFNRELFLAGDVFAIVAVARGLTYGQDYRFKVVCPECDTPEIVTIKVPAELPIISWEGKSLAELQESWTVLLPIARDSVKVRPLTIAEELSVSDSIRVAAASGSDASSGVYTMAAHIREVNGGAPDTLMEAVSYVRKLRGDDMTALQQVVADCSPGIKIKYDMLCDKCSNKYSTSIPLSADFFRRNRV